MGNCQATADAEAIVIYHPGIGCNGSYKIYRWSSVTAEEIMVLYPGYYVSLVGTVSTEEGIRLKQINLLRPRDTLSIGRVYRLISFEDVLLELSARTRRKLVVRGGEDEEDGGSRSRKKGPSRRTKSRTINRCSNEGSQSFPFDIGGGGNGTNRWQRDYNQPQVVECIADSGGHPWRASPNSEFEWINHEQERIQIDKM